MKEFTITQQEAEQLVYEQLLTEYPENEIKNMPYSVKIKGDLVYSTGEGWEDVYKMEYAVKLVQVS